MFYLSSGNLNTAIGVYSLGGAVYLTGSDNTAVGAFSGYSVSAGARNTFVGEYAGSAISGGEDNIHIGAYSGRQSASGNRPVSDLKGILIGAYSGRTVPSATVFTNYIGIGYGVQVDKSNQVKLGNPEITETVLYGAVNHNGVWHFGTNTVTLGLYSGFCEGYGTWTNGIDKGSWKSYDGGTNQWWELYK
jgi:hypothetical protein